MQAKIEKMRMTIQMKMIYIGNQKTIMLNKNYFLSLLKIIIRNKTFLAAKVPLLKKLYKKKEKAKSKIKILLMQRIEDLRKIGNQLKNLD